MKKLFINILIINISCIFAANEQLLHYVSDSTAGGSYKYYSLMYDGVIKIILISQKGDADLYLSQTISKPTYEPDQYCLQSTTCGDDIIFIPESFKRPVSIGVYGHPSHETSHYNLIVYHVALTDDESFDEHSLATNLDNNSLKKTLKIKMMLEYENQMFLEALQEDGLIIAAKGLGLETVFINILKVYSDPGNLVIVLGTTTEDEQYFLDELKSMNVSPLPKVITAHNTSNERETTYLEGGVLFMSGRIIVVDLLKKRVPLNLVTGILVYRAHKILNSYQEAFALRLYRQNNKTGFIKAFSNSALAFTVGFAKVERIMKTLFVKKLHLWPRFHSVVNDSLSKHKPEVIELHAKLTQKMLKIQTALLDVINFIVKEIKRLNKYLDIEELTVENVITKKFHKQLQSELDPIWHQLSASTKQSVADLKLLGYYLSRLTQENSVAFYAMINRLRSAEFAMRDGSGWLILDVVDDLFAHARSRIYCNKNELKPEPCPKWTALSEVLDEIRTQMNKEKNKPESSRKVLVLVYDATMAAQLKNYLTMGAGEYLLFEAMRCLKQNEISKPSKEKPVETKENITEPTEQEVVDHDSYILTFSQKLLENPDDQNSSQENLQTTINYLEECTISPDANISSLSSNAEPIVLIHSVKKGGDPMALHRTLYDLMPSYVIMYGADISSIRQLEVYQNNNPSISLKVFFLVYGGSVEEQGYLTALRREKEAFDKLINTKATMVVPTDQDGKSQISPQKIIEENSRKGGLEPSTNDVTPKVIVDIREFRSELPALLHKRGIDIEPLTLVVGDYILTPEICVERKSVSDLIMSLNSGRLYNQAVSMTRHYTKPMLLIEFDQNKSFCLQGNYYVSKDMRSSDVTAKLQLLTMHFPKLKIVWSPSPQATAQLFDELKQGRPQPDGQIATQIGLDEDIEDPKLMGEKYNTQIQDFIAKLPGVNSKNLRAILNNGESLDNLVKLSVEELTVIVGNKINAQMFHKALHDKHKSEVTPATTTISKASVKMRTKGLFSSKK